MANRKHARALHTPKDAYPIRHLHVALRASGDYVYAYYGKKDDPESPFYVGKGRGSRVLAHWINAASARPLTELNSQEVEVVNGDLKLIQFS